MTHLPPLDAALWVRVRDSYATISELSAPAQADALAELRRTEPEVALHVDAMLRTTGEESVIDRDVGILLTNLLAPDVDELPPQMFGPYRLRKVLGRGGMGMVYLGHREDLDTTAAIKVLPHAWIDPNRRDQFVEEMKILARLTHESIAGLLDAGRLDDDTPWFAMQHVEGKSISAWVWDHQLTADQILRLFVRLCAAVQYAHGQLVAHRDLKPSNVLVTADGSIKLLDFGVAERLEGFHLRSDEPSSSQRELTVEYAAPEQIAGEPAGVAADVYALGIILCELLTGRRPYDVSAQSPSDALTTIRGAYPWSIDQASRGQQDTVRPAIVNEFAERALRAEDRRDLDALLQKATNPDAGKRYDSVDAMTRDVVAFLELKPVTAREAGLGYRVRKFVHREWRPLSLAAVVLIAAFSALAFHNRTLRDSRDVAIAEAARTTRLRQYLEDLFQGGPQPARAPDSIRVATLVENGIRGARALTTDPVIQIELLGILGSISKGLGALVRADSLFVLAIDRSTAHYGPNHPETLRARIRRAELIALRTQPDSAERELRAIEALARRFAPPRHPVLAELDLALGTVLRERSDSTARFYLNRAMAAEFARDSTSREYASALRELGNAEGSLGNLARGDSLWLRALPLVEKLFGPNHPDVAWLYSNLGNTASQRGEFIIAEQNQRKAVAITSSWYGPDHTLTAATSLVLAQTLIRQRHFDEAIPILRKTIDVLSRAPDFGPASPNTSVAHSTLGVALSGQGDHAAAIHEYEIALAGLNVSVGEKARNTIVVAGSLGLEILLTGHADSAAALFRKQLAIAIDAFGAPSPVVGDMRIKLARALFAQHRLADAIAEAREGTRVIDAKLGARAPTARIGRRLLVDAYVATGDSVNAKRVRAELADSLGAQPARK